MEQDAKQRLECNFKPDLSLTQKISKLAGTSTPTSSRSVFVEVEAPDGTIKRQKVPPNLSMYIKNLKWAEAKDDRIKQ